MNKEKGEDYSKIGRKSKKGGESGKKKKKKKY